MGASTIGLALFSLFSVLTFMWMAVPTEQTLSAVFPNVVILAGFGSEKIDPISFDNNSLPELPAAEAGVFNGFYQYDPLFYHKSFDRFIPWEDRHKTYTYSCAVFCRPMNASAKEVAVVLVHYSPEPKKNLWYLLEMRDDDANSPIVIGRSKFRKEPTYTAGWMSVTPGGEHKPKDLKDVYIATAWDAFRFDTPLKLVVSAAIVLGIAYMCYTQKDKDD